MRVSRIVSAPNWRYAVGEVVLIVVAVTIALAATSWYETRQLRNDEFAALAQLKAALTDDLESLAIQYDTLANVNQGILSFVEQIENGEIEPAQIDNGVSFTGRFLTLNLRYGPYETLKARGLGLVSDESLRLKITSLYEDEIPNLVEDSVIDRHLSRDRVLPSILEWFRLDASDDWILRDTASAEWRSELVTLARYRAGTLTGYYLPSFERTMNLMKEVSAEIEAELQQNRKFD
jgi:hypothetical protein